MKRVLITGAGGAAASNFIKSLRMAPEKFYLIGTDAKPYHIELSDLNDRYILPPASDPNYLERLNHLVEKKNIDLVHPQPDPEVFVISENREKIKCRVFLPSKKTLRICQNKMQLTDLLAEKKVPVGESYLIRNRQDLKQAFDILSKKHEKIWLRATKGAGARASLPVNHLDHAYAWVDYWEQMKGTSWGYFMATEFLPGKEFAFQSIWKDGKLITSQARERLEYIFGYLTPSGQTSSPSVAKTVHNKDVNEIATKAVLAVDPQATGVFCIDLKENKKGTPCVTEINAGRFFTTSNFFSEAGSNMPYYYLKLAFSEKLPHLPKYNPIPAGWYWVRMVDMGFKLVRGATWKSKKI